MRCLAFLTAALWSSIALAELTATITGPEQSAVGDLVVLTLDTNAEQSVWFLGNSDKTFLAVDDGKRVVFSSGTPGKYVFFVAVFSAGEQPAKASHAVVIGKPEPTPPGPGPKPIPPGPGPIIPDGLAGKIYEACQSVDSANRATEAAAMAKVFRSVASRAAGLADMTPIKMLSETSAGLKESVSNLQPWQPFEDAFKRELKSLGMAIDDKPGHIEAWNEVARGLEAVR